MSKKPEQIFLDKINSITKNKLNNITKNKLNNDEDDLFRKITNPTTRQDIYDTIPNAKAIFEPSVVRGALKHGSVQTISASKPKVQDQRSIVKEQRKDDRAARVELRREQARRYAKHRYDKNLSDIEKNIK